MARRRSSVALAALLAGGLLALGIWLFLRRSEPTSLEVALPKMRRSVWVVPERRPPRLAASALAASAPPAAAPDAGIAGAPGASFRLAVRAWDVTGEPIEGAEVICEKRALGSTDATGTLLLDARAAALAPTGEIVVRAPGYAAGQAGHRARRARALRRRQRRAARGTPGRRERPAGAAAFRHRPPRGREHLRTTPRAIGWVASTWPSSPRASTPLR